jgi:hypothetical protein
MGGEARGKEVGNKEKGVGSEGRRGWGSKSILA